jgi:glycine cleavage system H protein
MPECSPGNAPIAYRRSRFSTRLPVDRLYTPSHYWLLEVQPGLWRVGFTKFATRMLGDLVEQRFDVSRGDPVSVGQAIGTVEGFKALTDLYCAVDGFFEEANSALNDDPTLTDTDPYGAGWLYLARGTPDANATDARRYTQLLDLTIDRMQETGGANQLGPEGPAQTQGNA